MVQIEIDGQLIDPYFILGVVETDNEQFITKSFKRKAKMWHPDKISREDVKDPIKVQNTKRHFKVLVESYEFIMNQLKSSNLYFRREIKESQSDKIKSIDNSDDLNLFNKKFNKLRVDGPNDFGYDVERMVDVNDYDNFEYKPYKQNFGDSKNFNKDDFNKAFEYQQEFYNENGSGEVGIYHKTSDGFNAYNGGDLGGSATVSSYNGIMIVGDTYGQSGIGYYDATYSDYKKTFEGPKNPNKILDIPVDFKQTNKTIKPLSMSESKRQVELQKSNRNMNKDSRPDKRAFKIQEQLLLEKQEQDIKDKLEYDKRVVSEYGNLFTDKRLVDSALEGNRLAN